MSGSMLLDDRAGSIDYYAPLLAETGHPDIELTRLAFGDAAWLGNGPDGLVVVGVEIKKVGDIVNCINDHRFAGFQLPGLLANFDVAYLLVEGNIDEWTFKTMRAVKRAKGARVSDKVHDVYAKVMNWLTSMEQSGIRIRQVNTTQQGARCLLALFNWWQKAWDRHKSLNVVYNAPERSHGVSQNTIGVQFIRREPSFLEHCLSHVDGVGYEKAKAVVDAKIATLEQAMAVSEKDWAKVDGIGKVLAGNIVGKLHEHGNQEWTRS